MTHNNYRSETPLNLLSIWAEHVKKEHKKKGIKRLTDCWNCWVNYFLFYWTSAFCLLNCTNFIEDNKKKKYKKRYMQRHERHSPPQQGSPNGSPSNKQPTWSSLLIVIIPLALVFIAAPILHTLIEHWLKKRKHDADSENIELKNKIIKEITYEQLQIENKRKNIGGAIQIFQQLNNLNDKLQRETHTEEGRKRLEILEKLQEELKESVDKGTKEKSKKLGEKKSTQKPENLE